MVAGAVRKYRNGSVAGPCGDSMLFVVFLRLFHFLHAEAPFTVFAFELIAIGPCFSKAVEVALSELFLVNDGRDDVSEAGIAEGRADVIRAP